MYQSVHRVPLITTLSQTFFLRQFQLIIILLAHTLGTRSFLSSQLVDFLVGFVSFGGDDTRPRDPREMVRTGNGNERKAAERGGLINVTGKTHRRVCRVSWL